MTLQGDVDKMKLFGRNQNKDKDVEKPIVLHYAKYIGVLSSNKSYPLEEGAYVNFYEDRVVIDLLKSKHQTVIPYKNMTEIQNVDAGKKFDLDRIVGLVLWVFYGKDTPYLQCIKYSDDDSKPQTMALDFMA